MTLSSAHKAQRVTVAARWWGGNSNLGNGALRQAQATDCASDNAGFAQKQFVWPRLFSTMPP
jgi:hypothetical protein